MPVQVARMRKKERKEGRKERRKEGRKRYLCVFKISVQKIQTSLCEIMGRYGSDKGSIDITNCHHNYTTFYYRIFKDIKSKCSVKEREKLNNFFIWNFEAP